MSKADPRPKNMIVCRWLYAANRQSDFSVQNFAHLLSIQNHVFELLLL
jgi:hypothetical protein